MARRWPAIRLASVKLSSKSSVCTYSRLPSCPTRLPFNGAVVAKPSVDPIRTAASLIQRIRLVSVAQYANGSKIRSRARSSRGIARAIIHSPRRSPTCETNTFTGTSDYLSPTPNWHKCSHWVRLRTRASEVTRVKRLSQASYGAAGKGQLALLIFLEIARRCGLLVSPQVCASRVSGTGPERPH